MAYLIDSDVLIWHLRGREPTVQLLRTLAQGSREEEAVLPLGCSVISVFEVGVGMHPEERASTERFLSALERYPVGEVIAERAADYYRAFVKQGTTLHIADVVIAATAAEYGLTLVTYNHDHFPMEDIRLYTSMPEF